MNHYYVYTFADGRYTYERTCGTERGAEDRIEELKKRGLRAIYLINHLIRGAFY